MKRALAALLASLLLSAPATADVVLKGRVVSPPSVDASQLSVTVFHEPPTEVEGDWSPGATAVPDSSGAFGIAASPGESTQLEVTGPGVRRARFPWPKNMPSDSPAQAVFELDPGFAIAGSVRDADTHGPVPGLLIGPVVPGPDAGRDAMERSYPFFVEPSPDGSFVIDGLSSDCSWIVPFHSPSHERQTLRMRPGLPMTIDLHPGGAAISGTLAGSRTLDPVAFETILLQGGPRDFHIVRRTGESGEWSMDGLPAGEYRIASWSPDKGTGPAQTFAVVRDHTIGGVTLLYPEGIRVSGALVDVETGDTVPDARVEIGGAMSLSGPEGRFEVYPVEAPWPREARIDHPEFAFRTEDQDASLYPVDGSDGSDLDVGNLLLRRKRVLEVTASDVATTAVAGGILEVFGNARDATPVVDRARIPGDYAVVPLDSAGTRGVVLRSSGDRVSDLVFVETDLRQTTTTLRLRTDAGGTLRGSLAYEATAPDDGEAPLAPAFEVRLEAAWPNASGRFALRTASPLANGSFEMPGLPPGDYTLVLERAGGEPWLVEPLAIARGETLEMHRTVPRGVRVEGVVVGPIDEPLREVTVSIYGRDPLGHALHLKAVSGADGAFFAEGFGGDTLELVSASHAVHGEAELRGAAISSLPVRLTMTPPPGIRVTVPVASGGEAILLLARERPMSDGTTQRFYEIDAREAFAGGAETFLRPRSAGTMRVAAGANGQWTVSPAFEWRSDAAEKDVHLDPSDTAGLVCAIEGIEPEDIGAVETVLLNTALPESLARTEFQPSSVRGRDMRFDGIPTGEYLLIAYGPDGESASVANIDVRAGETASVRVELSSPGTDLVGRIVSGGDGISGVRVALRADNVPEAPVLLEALTGADGVFTLFPLSKDSAYLLTATGEGIEQTWPFVAKPDESGIVVRDFEVRESQSVALEFPADLRARVASPGPPLLLRSDAGGETTVVPTPYASEPVELSPGTWTVMHGEDEIGRVVVGKGTRTARLIP